LNTTYKKQVQPVKKKSALPERFVFHHALEPSFFDLVGQVRESQPGQNPFFFHTER
jgi:hypothetical protein